MHPSTSERGQAAFFVLLALIPICLATGLVVDVGMAYYTKNSARTAAQTAALAAAQAAIDGIYQGGTYTCGSLGLGCQTTPGACPTTGNLYQGCLYATANGFTNTTGGAQTVLIDAGIGTPPVANITNANYWVRVQIIQKNPLTFGATTGLSFMNVAATAVAAAVNMMPLNCVVALSPNANAALNLVGNVTLTTTDCGVAVDSNSSTALSANGSTILSASSIGVVGGTNTGGTTVTPTPVTGITPFRDPLEGVPAPTVPSACPTSSPATTGSGRDITYSPGVYCGGLSIGSNTNVTLNPGTYFLVDGGLSIPGNATLTGTGVTFYLTSANSSCSSCTISMSGTPSGNLSAPTSGPLQGILFFGDRNVSMGQSTIVGNSGFNLAGAVYLPNSAVSISGDATSEQMMLVANTVSMNGNVTLTINPEAAPSPIIPQISAALIQ